MKWVARITIGVVALILGAIMFVGMVSFVLYLVWILWPGGAQ